MARGRINIPLNYMPPAEVGTSEPTLPARKLLEVGLQSLEGAASVAKPIAEMLPGSGFVTGVQKGGSEGGADVLAELLAIIGGFAGSVGGPAGTAAGYTIGKSAYKGLRKLLDDLKIASRSAEPLDIGVDKSLVSGKAIKNYNEKDFNILDELISKGKATAGTKEANKLLNAPIKKGTNIGVRLNLNSKIEDTPKNLKPMLQTLHKNSASGKALSYKPYATVVGTKNKKVKFHVSPKGREDIATGKKSKHPAMSVNGSYDPNLKILPSDKGVVEIGFNPKAHHLFIDLKTGQAVKEADAATIIGDRVYAKGITYFKKSEAPEPITALSQVRYREKKKGGSVIERNLYNYQPRAI
tara:strand:+ start:390 stop:1451 length:1062 start_codon:yes stop_codon:yes gene_type:complete